MANKIEDIKSTKKSKIINYLFIVAAIITLIGFLVDLRNTITYPGTDLRNRVVGARLMLEGIDPYFFKWQPGLSARFYDPLDIPTELLSKLSVPPTVLVMHSAVAGLSYLQQKIIWLVVQWAVFIGTILIFIKASDSQLKTLLIAAIGFLFANSLFWRFHVNSGQIYIVYVFILSIAWLLLNNKYKFKKFKINSAASGLLIGLVVSLRPSFILFFIPFIICQRYSFLLGGIFGFISSVSLSCIVTGTSIWKKYVLTMLGMTGFIDLNTYLPLPERTLLEPNITYPKIIEGFNPAIRNPLERYLDNTSLYDVLNALDIPNKRQILAIGFIITILLLSLCILKYYLKNKNTNHLFLSGVLICLIGDFFVPVGRYSYYDVQMMLPLLIMINQANVKDLVGRKIIVLVFGLLLSIVGFAIIPRALFFSTFLIMMYIILSFFVLLKNEHQTSVLPNKQMIKNKG